MSIGRRIIEGIGNFLYVEVDEKKSGKSKPARKNTAAKPKKTAAPETQDELNLGWLVVLEEKKTSAHLKCRSGKLSELAVILGQVEEKFPGAKVTVRWPHHLQGSLPRGWIAMELRAGGSGVDAQVKAKLLVELWRLVKASQ